MDDGADRHPLDSIKDKESGMIMRVGPIILVLVTSLAVTGPWIDNVLILASTNEPAIEGLKVNIGEGVWLHAYAG